ncbi:MAG: hypothetical protein U0531_19285 [Dehalococcoidia bacterium]
MRVHAVGLDWYGRRLRRQRWTPGAVLVSLLLGVLVVSLVITLLSVALVAAILAGVGYLSYRVVRALMTAPEPRPARIVARPEDCWRWRGPPIRSSLHLLAVREFDRFRRRRLPSTQRTWGADGRGGGQPTWRTRRRICARP